MPELRTTLPPRHLSNCLPTRCVSHKSCQQFNDPPQENGVGGATPLKWANREPAVSPYLFFARLKRNNSKFFAPPKFLLLRARHTFNPALIRFTSFYFTA